MKEKSEKESTQVVKISCRQYAGLDYTCSKCDKQFLIMKILLTQQRNEHEGAEIVLQEMRPINNYLELHTNPRSLYCVVAFMLELSNNIPGR